MVFKEVNNLSLKGRKPNASLFKNKGIMQKGGFGQKVDFVMSFAVQTKIGWVCLPSVNSSINFELFILKDKQH